MKKDPKICLTMVSSTGTWLRESLSPQHHFIALTIEDTEGKIIARVAMTFDQFTHMLVSNGETTCTLERYRDANGKMAEDVVTPPPTIEDKMKERMKEYRENLGARMNDVYKDIYEMMNSGVKPGKKKLEELLRDIDTVRSHFKANENFVMQQTEEELSQMQENARVQLSTYLKTLGADIAPSEIKFLSDPTATKLIASGETRPILEPYTKKIREDKPMEDMTSRELADHIHYHLRRLEATQSEETAKDGHQILFSSGCSESGAKGVNVRYVSYQGHSFLPNENARRYLIALRTIKDIKGFKHHWGVLDESKGNKV
jgi:hypothetical protein